MFQSGPPPRFLLIGSRVAASRLSRKIQKNRNQAAANLYQLLKIFGSG